MKKIISYIIAVATLTILLCACGMQYTCNDCGKTTSKAYYDMDADIEDVLCEDCAREYWMPLDYRTYRVN